MLAGVLHCLVDQRAQVTECPLWDAASATLYFVDIHAGRIMAYDWDSGALRAIETRQAVGCIGLAGPGRLIAGLESSVALIDVQSGVQRELARIAHRRSGSRLNDGRCDPAGRFWVGSMKETLDEAAGALYRIDGDGAVSVQEEDIICSNGLAFSPDGRTMYHADSRRRTVWRYAYDPATGTAAERRVFAVAPEGEGRPDGAAVDTEGHYWIARYGGGRIVRHAPDGSEVFVLRLPVENPTMCAFAGHDLSTLVITSARGSLSSAQLASQPQAGSVFAVKVNAQGSNEPHFRPTAQARQAESTASTRSPS
ncbi:SMP-30/gluconolactonase/LRE family protein [Verticiella sediminum]|uniref:SMP-30/gluconolactonase/LRE family protein n=1 Tax=Verticiella sediminum TaxID=1247510 RepID=A0A556AB92_9BURK|nr:SMP-30/gluconolactonase/LRE family protein [Verticiella sediminum]TSH90141.1 SMP-30/gluconolactonase/LRE family protein [Verticiella sediminum]